MKQGQQVYIIEQVLDAVKSNLNPEDVFDEETLEEWAEANGYVKKED